MRGVWRIAQGAGLRVCGERGGVPSNQDCDGGGMNKLTMREADNLLFTIWLHSPEISFPELQALEKRFRKLYGETPTVLRIDGRQEAA
jgi:hypothetical protein